jgi:hypothetical protein
MQTKRNSLKDLSLTSQKDITVFDLISEFVDELIFNGIQKKRPKAAIPNVWNGRKRKAKYGPTL